jgi:hypothetical protein
MRVNSVVHAMVRPGPRSPAEGGSVSCGSEASRAERLPTVVSGRPVHRACIAGGRRAKSSGFTLRRGQAIRAEACALKNERTHRRRHHHRHAGSSQGGEHVGRKVRPKLPYRRWDSARDVTPVSVMAVAGGAALAHTLTVRAASRAHSAAWRIWAT